MWRLCELNGVEICFRCGIDRTWYGLDASEEVLTGRKESKITPKFLGGAFINSINICWAAHPAPMPFTVS